MRWAGACFSIDCSIARADHQAGGFSWHAWGKDAAPPSTWLSMPITQEVPPRSKSIKRFRNQAVFSAENSSNLPAKLSFGGNIGPTDTTRTRIGPAGVY